MLDPDALSFLAGKRNLLAFSGGVDSTALFFLLKEAGIAFDIAHVNYHTRPASDAEAAYAVTLAHRFEKHCHVHNAGKITANFEAAARSVRYNFFETLIRQHGYDALLTAHQLDDRLEWLLMQLCKGAGLPELLGMEVIGTRNGYHLVRPLLFTAKADLKTWLDTEEMTYFEDVTNKDERIVRNRFRHRFSAPLLEECRSGIEKSFRYLAADAQWLKSDEEVVQMDDVLLLTRIENRLNLMRILDRWLKARGILMRRGEKERMMQENELIISRRYALSIGGTFALSTPLCDAVMPKPFKEQCRRLGIGAAVRPYLFKHPGTFEQLLKHLPPEQPENAG